MTTQIAHNCYEKFQLDNYAYVMKAVVTQE
jgi:hypothetical protein